MYITHIHIVLHTLSEVEIEHIQTIHEVYNTHCKRRGNKHRYIHWRTRNDERPKSTLSNSNQNFELFVYETLYERNNQPTNEGFSRIDCRVCKFWQWKNYNSLVLRLLSASIVSRYVCFFFSCILVVVGRPFDGWSCALDTKNQQLYNFEG